MEYDLYHDESKEAGYWHGMLLVPRDTRQMLLDELESIRERTGFTHPVALKNIDKESGPKYRCVQAWLHFGVGALIQNMKGQKYPFYTGKKTRNVEFQYLTEAIGARFILFRIRDAHKDLEGYPDYASKVETTFRMGLKGGLHLFVDETDVLVVKSFHFDGHEHYQRKIDINRIVGRLGTLRERIEIPANVVIDDRKNDHRRKDSQEYDDCQLLQLTDLFVGGFRTKLGIAASRAQNTIAYPLGELSDKWKRGPSRMMNSRWYRSFCISECFLEEDEWKFSNISPPTSGLQLGLF